MSEIAHEVEQMAHAIAQNLHTVEHQKENKIVFKKDIAPEWITEVIYAVHTAEGFEFMPHDTTCEFIDEAARMIADSSADTFDELLDEECNIESDVYTSDLLKWAQNNPNRLCEKLESCATTIVQSLSMAQEEHKREIFDILLNKLRERAEKAAEERFEKPIADTVKDAKLMILRPTERPDLDEGQSYGYNTMSLVKSKRELTDAVEQLVERVARLERIIEEIEVYENEARLNALL
ncbi:MAG: hypothetical protein ABSD89_07545 [Halobacteriota archaeon]